jgi:hypothetical protein
LTVQQQDPDQTERHSKLVIPMVWRITGELQIEALRGALDEVVERHEALRTRIHYDETGSGGYQEVLPPLPVPFTVQDIPLPAGRAREQQVLDLYVTANEERLDFSAVPSLRAKLYRFDDQDAVFTAQTHHLFGDHWSIGVFRRELAACYNARVSGIPHSLRPPVQYREYSTWQREFLQSAKAVTARQFWLDTLSGAQLVTLPTDRPFDPDTLAAQSMVRTFRLDSQHTAKMSASAARNRCSVWHLLLAAVMVLTEEVRGSADITLLTVNNSRDVKDFRGTIGFFANLIPLHLSYGDCRSFQELMLLARRTSVAAHQNAIPIREILGLVPDLMNSFGAPGAMPFVFNYVKRSPFVAEFQFADKVEPVATPEEVPAMYHRGACSWDLEISVSGALRCVVEYEPSMVDTATIDRWGSQFINLLRVIADRPEQAWQPAAGRRQQSGRRE